MSVIDELKRLEKEATPGPWEWRGNDADDPGSSDNYKLGGPYTEKDKSEAWDCGHVPPGIAQNFVLDDGSAGGEYAPCIHPDSPNAKLIALMRNSLPALLAVVDAAREFQSLTHWGMSDSEAKLSDKLSKALAELEK